MNSKRVSFVGRVTRSMALLAILSSFAMAAIAAVISMVLWRADERRALEDTTVALTARIEEQAREDEQSYEEAAPEGIEDSAVPGYRIEIWNGGKLLTPVDGEPLGPPGEGLERTGLSGWLVKEHEFPGGVTLLVGAPKADERHAIGIFAWSLLLALPICLALALLVGWIAGRRVTRPLVEFTRRISEMSEQASRMPGGVIPASGFLVGPGDGGPGAAANRAEPAEIADLREAFGSLLDRLSGTLRRELEFAANASHELRTPLTTIRLQAERAGEGMTLQARRALDEQIREIDRTVRLVDSLLVLARDSETGIPLGETVNLADLVREFSGRIFERPNGHVGKPPTVALDLPDEALVTGDEALLGIAVENLLDNARKFTPPGEAVRVRLDSDAARHRLSVTSGGVRIGAAEQSALFERFYRSPEARARNDGHGLGLPLCRHIARLHGGDVHLRSTPEQDACFTLEIPVWSATGRG